MLEYNKHLLNTKFHTHIKQYSKACFSNKVAVYHPQAASKRRSVKCGSSRTILSAENRFVLLHADSAAPEGQNYLRCQY